MDTIVSTSFIWKHTFCARLSNKSARNVTHVRNHATRQLHVDEIVESS